MKNFSRRALMQASLLSAVPLIGGCGDSDPTEKSKASESVTKKKQEPVNITFYYPVNVGGKAANLVDTLVSDFNRENPDIHVEPVYTGNYMDTILALRRAKREGDVPELYISLAGQRFNLKHSGMAMSLNHLIEADPDGKAYLADFLPGFMTDSVLDGKVFSIPFQRSTEIVFYNKDLFRKAGLDPENFPKTWDGLREAAQKISDLGLQGVGLALNRASVQWTFTGFALSNSSKGQNLMSDDGKQVFFDTPENAEILKFWTDLQGVHKCMPSGIIEWTDLPIMFLNQQIGIIYHTTGNIAKIASEAKFEFGCAFMPGNKRMAAPTGGGNFYISDGISEEKQKAAWRFIRFCTDTNRQAMWCANTGYVPVRESCYKTDAILSFYKKVPQARVAYEQLLQSLCGPELQTYAAEEIWDILDQNIESAILGQTSVETALKQAQIQADAVLKAYRQKAL